MEEDTDEFLRDLETAMALSLETAALENFKNQTVKYSSSSSKPSSPNQMKVPLLRSNVDVVSRQRPRPSARNSLDSTFLESQSIGSINSIPPPPLPSRNEKGLASAATNRFDTDLISWCDALDESRNNKKYRQNAVLDLYCINEPSVSSNSVFRLDRTISPKASEELVWKTSTQKLQNYPLESTPIHVRKQKRSNIYEEITAGINGAPFVISKSGANFVPSSSIPRSMSWSNHRDVNITTDEKELSEFSVRNSQSDFCLKSSSNTASKLLCSHDLSPTVSLIDFGPNAHLETVGHDEYAGVTKVSFLDAFDPLCEVTLSSENVQLEEENKKEELYASIYQSTTHSEGSFYEAHDPFEYMHAKIKVTEYSCLDSKTGTVDPNASVLYEKVVDSTISAEAYETNVKRRKKQKADYEKVVKQNNTASEFQILFSDIKKGSDLAVDKEASAFASLVSEIRSQFVWTDSCTNRGLIVNSKLECTYPENTSIKLVVYSSDLKSNVKFTINVDSEIAHVICQASCDLAENSTMLNEYALQIFGVEEFLLIRSRLCEYEYIYQCYKFDEDVTLVLTNICKGVRRSLARTATDDKSDMKVRLQDIVPLDQTKTITFGDLRILFETLKYESDRIAKVARNILLDSPLEVSDLEQDVTKSSLQPKRMIQAVKAVCAMLGDVETLELTECIDTLINQCINLDQAKSCVDDASEKLRPEIVEEIGHIYSNVILTTVSKINSDLVKQIQSTLDRTIETIQKQVEIYGKTYRLNYAFSSPSNNLLPQESITVDETLLVRICGLHRLQPQWSYQDYFVTLNVYHGTLPIIQPLWTSFRPKSKSLYDRIVFDVWLEAASLPIQNIPREARLVFSLVGRNLTVDESNTSTTSAQTDLGWCSVQLFDYDLFLAQGMFFLPIWPPNVERQVGPAPDAGSHPSGGTCPLLSIELPELASSIQFPSYVPSDENESNSQSSSSRMDFNFEDLDYETRQQLRDICDQDFLTFTELPVSDREVIWEKRLYLTEIPGALPKVLLAAHSWDFRYLGVLYDLLKAWKRPCPMDILQLFLPCFPDTYLRKVAIDWLSNITCDEMIDYLPQLLEALKHETWTTSPLSKLLLERALVSPRVCYSLYWLLMQTLPGSSPQNTIDNPVNDEFGMKVARYRRRLQMFLRALYAISGDALRTDFMRQQHLLKYLNEAADNVKSTSKDSLRSQLLLRCLEALDAHLVDNVTALPLRPSLYIRGVDFRASSYFNSNTFPLRLHFVSDSGAAALVQLSAESSGGHGNAVLESKYIQTIYKVGDDLRQDMLTIQVIRIMEKLWLKAGIDFKMVTFSCVPTGDGQGLIELVTKAKTLREIQVKGAGVAGVTGSFKDTPISEWLKKCNPSQLEFAKAVDNFTRSCAGYCIVTYILGICDRHNDNIMVKESGHLFHIDFGKFLGDAQMIGNFKRDRTPFVLTPDMVYVINDGVIPSKKFQDFVDLCCQGFNVIRRHGNLLLNLFALMASSGIPGVTMNAVSYVQSALLPDLSNSEAAITFSRMIEESVRSVFTQINFFFHNIAQLKLGGVEAGGSSSSGGGSSAFSTGLSFVPKIYNLVQDGRITAVQVCGVQKRYQPERHYVFILKINRVGVKDPVLVFRTYKEFCELDSKLGIAFPETKYRGLRKGIHLRQEVRHVADQRRRDIALFLTSLFNANDDIGHCDLVYTFFHPLLRDQVDANIHLSKLKDQKVVPRRVNVGSVIKGHLKISLEYRRGTLYVMICHARDLNLPSGNKELPNSYVKVYLLPDERKLTKRKTKVVRKNSNPIFMEMLEYRMMLDVIRSRKLQATVWDSDLFQENTFLGAITIPLDNLEFDQHEISQWYSLTSFSGQ